MDIVYHVIQVLQSEFGETFHPCPLIKHRAIANELGVKTGKGFYDYSQK
jgi:3-hydroxybutyryl-CoA dehydrogenase